MTTSFEEKIMTETRDASVEVWAVRAFTMAMVVAKSDKDHQIDPEVLADSFQTLIAKAPDSILLQGSLETIRSYTAFKKEQGL